MTKTIKTKEELQANIEKAKTEIRQGENYVKQLLKQTSHLERKQRSHRFIERGALLESMIKEADAFTNEQPPRAGLPLARGGVSKTGLYLSVAMLYNK